MIAVLQPGTWSWERGASRHHQNRTAAPRSGPCGGSLTAYLGSGDAFDRAVTTFAEPYAEQNERDYATFTRAIKSGRLESAEGF